MESPLGTARSLGLDDLAVAEPVRPPGPEARLALDCGRRARVLRRVPWLGLDADRLTVAAPALLSAPLVVPRDLVAVAILDTRERDGGETLRFPYSHEYDWSESCSSDQAEIYGWLYRGGRSPLPLILDCKRLPNLAVVFTEPVDGRPGFLTRACDPEATRTALRDWGVMRRLTVADAERAGVPVAVTR